MLEKFEEIKAISMYAVIGIITGLIEIGTMGNKDISNFERFSIVATSILFAIFATPSVVWVLEVSMGSTMPEKVTWGICIVVSKFGEKALNIAVNICKTLDWKGIILSILTRNKK